MHHFIFPTKDTYITNQSVYDDKNFGLDEILRVGSYSQYSKIRVYTQTYTYPSNQYVSCLLVDDFEGTITGSFSGSAAQTSGSILGTGVFTSSYFFGTVTGSVSGSDAGTPITNSIYTGSLTAFSGSISSSASGINGYITSSLIADYFVTYTGYISGSTGVITGYISGSNTANEQGYEVVENKLIDRALLKFDISVISSSIAAGEITSPSFRLKMKVAQEEELPLSYSIYVFPVSQSWERGTGYLSDGGADDGASWYWRNYNSGSYWYPITASSFLPTQDYLNNSESAIKSFERGGGTWYYKDSLGNSVRCTQSFDYETSDLYLNITPIVQSWLSGSLPNEGLIVMNSVENQSGSNGIMTFFSRDTNTIFSPAIDVMWDDATWATGSLSTGSVVITTIGSGISASIQSGSSLTIAGGVAGLFSGSVFLLTGEHYITASGVTLTSATYQRITGSLYGDFSGVASSISGSISGSGIFTASYFSGSIDGTIFEYNDTGVSSSLIDGSLTGSIQTTGSITLFSGSITSSTAVLSGIFSGHYLDTASHFASGIVAGTGKSGNIVGLPVYGNIIGTLDMISEVVTGPCGNSFTASILTASFTNGVFSGSTFGAYYVDYQLENAYLSGSWTENSLLGTEVSIPIPSGIDPYAYAYVVGDYVNGKALGTYTLSGSLSGSTGTTSASFYGQFIEGNLLGGILNVQLSGSVYTSSYQYTSSVIFLSSSLGAVNISGPFVAVIQNLKPIYASGNVARINVFGREEHPLKNFTRKTQLTQYLTPNYLPSSSFYSIKDNETEEIIVDFDNYTKLSCDGTGNYFLLDMTGFAQERRYRIRLKVEDDKSVYVFDNGDVFKIVR